MKKHAILLLLTVCALHAIIPEKKAPMVHYLFSHGIADTYRQAYNYAKTYTLDNKTYTNNRYILEHPFTTFDYPDATTNFWRVNFWKTSLGQKNEIYRLKQAYEDLLGTYQHSITFPNLVHYPDIVLCGLSRGASTIVNFLGKHNPQYVKAVILESPFDHGLSVVQHKNKKINARTSDKINKIRHAFLPLIFMKYKIYGAQPLNSVEHITNKNLPILIICSQQDTLVPWQGSVRLYEKFKTEGFVNCELLVLERGKHGKLLWGPDGQKYHDAVQMFYKKHNLPYI